MKKHLLLGLSLLILSILIISCTNKKKEDTQANGTSNESLSNGDTSILADKNFPIKNMQNTLPLWKSLKFYKEKLYANSTHRVAFVELTKQQKLKLIAPFIKKELGVKDKSVIEDLFSAFFIAKQEKVGDFQPIILYISYDDYSSFTMIVLNKNHLVIDGFNLCGGVAGPYSTGDSLTTYVDKSYSSINKNQITTSEIIKSDFADSLKKPSIVDSNVFMNVIDSKGKIVAKQIVKARYRVPYKP